MSKRTTIRDCIPIVEMLTEVRAEEIEKLLNGPGFYIGVQIDHDNPCKVVLNQVEAKPPYDQKTIRLVRDFAESYSKLIDHISV